MQATKTVLFIIISYSWVSLWTSKEFKKVFAHNNSINSIDPYKKQIKMKKKTFNV